MHNIKTVKHVLIVFMLLISIAFAQAKEMKEHKVIKGDTLWDLSAKELNDPFLWSDIWMANLWIKDPDLIYPNQTIKLPLYLARVQPRDEQVTPAPAPVMAKAIEEPVRQEDERAAVATKLTTVVDEPVVPKETPREEDTPKPVAVAQKPATVKAAKEIAQKKQPLPVGLNQFVASGYMADTIPAVGWVGKSASGMTLFGSYDNLPVVLDQPGRVGDAFYVVKVSGPVYHPVTNAQMGYVVTIRGIAEIVKIENGEPIAKVTKCFGEIFRGDRLIPYYDIKPSMVRAGFHSKDLDGVIVATANGLALQSVLDIVYVDKGCKDGLEAGDTFDTLTLAADRPGAQNGVIQVLSCQDHTATAIIRYSRLPVSSGHVFTKADPR